MTPARWKARVHNGQTVYTAVLDGYAAQVVHVHSREPVWQVRHMLTGDVVSSGHGGCAVAWAALTAAGEPGH